MKRFRHVCARVRRRIQADGHDERLVAGHPVATLIRKVPLEPEVPLATRRSVRRGDGNEERAVADLATDLLVPHIPAPQLALIEPDFDALGPKRVADPTRSIGVLRSVAKEYRLGRRGHLVWRLCPHPGLLMWYAGARMPRDTGFRQRGPCGRSAFHRFSGCYWEDHQTAWGCGFNRWMQHLDSH